MVSNEFPLRALLGQAREDRSALGKLLQYYRPLLTQLAECSLSDGLAARCGASDVVQQTMIDAVRDFDRFAGSTEPEFSAWIKKIHHHNVQEVVRTHVQTDKRSLRREQQLFRLDGTVSFNWIEPAADQSTPSQQLIEGEQALRLSALLQSLPDTQREAVMLRHLKGWSIERIAKRLDRSVSAAAGLIKRGLQALREKTSEKSWG
jgi:RNA polymerase sigma-70 factor, ECF subfamily